MMEHWQTSRIFYKGKDHKDAFYNFMNSGRTEGGFHMSMVAYSDPSQTPNENEVKIEGCNGVIWRKLNKEDECLLISNYQLRDPIFLYYPNVGVICSYDRIANILGKNGSLTWMYGGASANNILLSQDCKLFNAIATDERTLPNHVNMISKNKIVYFMNGKMNWLTRADENSDWEKTSYDAPNMGDIPINHGEKYFFNGVGKMSGFYDESGKYSNVTTAIYTKVINGEVREFSVNMATWGMTNDCEYCACLWSNTRTNNDLLLTTGGTTSPWMSISRIENPKGSYFKASPLPRTIDNHLFIHHVNANGVQKLRHYYIGDGNLQPQIVRDSVTLNVLSNDYGVESVRISFSSDDVPVPIGNTETIVAQGYSTLYGSLAPVGMSYHNETLANSYYFVTTSDSQGRKMIVVFDSLMLDNGFAFYVDSVPSGTCLVSNSAKERIDTYLAQGIENLCPMCMRNKAKYVSSL